MLLLQYNADPSIVNGSGETAKEVTHDKDIRSMLEGNFNRSKFVLFCFFFNICAFYKLVYFPASYRSSVEFSLYI